MSEINKQKFDKLKSDYEKWSGFSLKSETQEEVLEEIHSMVYTLECEISDYGRKLSALAKEALPED